MKRNLTVWAALLLLLCQHATAQQNNSGPKKKSLNYMATTASQTNVKFGVKIGGGDGGGSSGVQRSNAGTGGKAEGKGGRITKRSCMPGSGICDESSTKGGGYTFITWGWDNNANVLSMTLDTNALRKNDPTEDGYFQKSSSTFPSVPWGGDFSLDSTTCEQLGLGGAGMIIPANCTDTLSFTGPNSAVLSFYNVIDVEQAYVILGQPGQLTSSGLYGIFSSNLPQSIYGSSTPVTPVQAKFEFRKLSDATQGAYKVTMVVNYADLVKYQPWVQKWLTTGASTFQTPVAGFPFTYMQPYMLNTANLFLPNGAYPQSVDASNNIRVDFTANYNPIAVPGPGTISSLMGGQPDQLIPVATGTTVDWHFGSLWSNGCDPNQGGLCYISQNRADFPVAAQVYYDGSLDATNYDNVFVLVDFDTLSLSNYNQANNISNNAIANFMILDPAQYLYSWINPGSILIKSAIPTFKDTFGLQCVGIDTIGFYNPDGSYNISVSLMFLHWISGQYAPNVSSGDVATAAKAFIKNSAIKRKAAKKVMPKKK